MIQPFLRSDIANITFFVQYYALLKSIISFKGKDYNTFSDGNNHIFSLFICVPVYQWDIILHYYQKEIASNQSFTPPHHFCPCCPIKSMI